MRMLAMLMGMFTKDACNITIEIPLFCTRVAAYPSRQCAMLAESEFADVLDVIENESVCIFA